MSGIESAREAYEKGWDVHVQSGKDKSGQPTLRYVIYTGWETDPSRTNPYRSQA